MVTGAANFAWSSPVIPKLISNDTTINPLVKPVTTMEISMITGLPAIAGIPGSLLIAPLSDKIGRIKCLEFNVVGMLLSNTVTAFSTKAIYIIISRCTFQLFYSGVLTITPIFLTEMTEDHNRARYGCFMQLFPIMGSLYAFLFGPFLNYRYFTLSIMLPSMASLVLLFFIPETPFFLLSKGRSEECKKALKKLRSNKHDKEIEIDLNKLFETLKSIDDTKNITVASIFKMKEARTGFVLAFIPNLLLFGSGGPVLMPFIGPIFSHAGTGLSGDTVGIIIGVLKCILFFTTALVIEKLGKKPLLLISSIGCGLFMVILTCYFGVEHYHSSMVSRLGWLPLVTIILYFISFSIGVGSIPPSLVGEMFILELRSAASACMVTIIAVIVCILTSLIPILTINVGIYVCFGVFAVNCLLGALFIYFMLPETRGKSLIEIQDLLKNYKFGFRRNT